MKDRAARILTALHSARLSFWHEFASHFPEITTGDFSPDADIEFCEATESAVNIWINANPARIICRQCYTCCSCRKQSLKQDSTGIIWLKCNTCLEERRLTLQDLAE